VAVGAASIKVAVARGTDSRPLPWIAFGPTLKEDITEAKFGSQLLQLQPQPQLQLLSSAEAAVKDGADLPADTTLGMAEDAMEAVDAMAAKDTKAGDTTEAMVDTLLQPTMEIPSTGTTHLDTKPLLLLPLRFQLQPPLLPTKDIGWIQIPR
jgi:hypothetical protein